MPIRNGLGDNIIFNKVISEIFNMYGDKEIIVGTNYPYVYKNNKRVKVMDIFESALYEDIDRFNVYRFMFCRRWHKTIFEAYKQMLIEDEANNN